MEENKTNPVWLNRAASRMDSKDCSDDPLFVELVELLHNLNPSANSAYYLGLLNDYTGPYGALGPALELGQRAFWLWANTAGGVGDYSVAIAEGGDAQYNPAKHLEVYNSMRDDVAALAMSLGTPQTLFILDELDKDNMIAAPMSWY